jgi:hypothetical protein
MNAPARTAVQRPEQPPIEWNQESDPVRRTKLLYLLEKSGNSSA